MRLKSLEISGFKSFRNRTRINFTEGITALVGPNGCGKTNIVDAMRWVLGELSPSLMRCDKMADVIFSGASDKKPSGVAEVTLTLHNDDGDLPLDYSEVAITRRLYRSNESEYYINKESCRLKDIHNMLLNSGVSHKAYSVFENSMIDRVLARDPTYKRLFFEEASKVAKYRERKLEALRKLSATENDLINLKEVIAEAERYTSSLKRQASRTRRHTDLKQRLSLLKAAGLKGHYARLKHSIAATSERLEKDRTERKSLLDALSRGELEIQELKKESEEFDSSLTELACQLDAMDKTVSELEKDVLVCKERIRAEKEGFEKERKEFDANTSMKESLSSSIESNYALLEDITKELSLTRGRLHEAEDLLETIGQSDLYEQREQLSERVSSQSRAILEIEASLDARTKKVEALEGEMRSVREKRDAIVQALSTCETSIADLLTRDRDFGKKMRVLEEKTDRETDEISRFDEQVARISAQLSEKGLTPHPWIESTYSILRDHVKVDPEYDRAIRGALGIRLMAPIMRDSEDLLKTAGRLREEKIPRGALLHAKPKKPPIAPIPHAPWVIGRALDYVNATGEARSIVNWLLTDCIIVNDLSAAIAAATDFPNLSFVTLDGDLLERDGTLWAGLLSDEQKKKLTELSALRDNLKKNLSLLKSELKSVTEERSGHQIRRAELSSEKSRLSSEVKSLEQRTSSIASELAREKDEIASEEKELKTRKARSSRLRKELGRMDQSLSSERNDREALIGERNELRIKLGVAEEKSKAVRKEIERDKMTLKESQGELAELEDDIRKGTGRLEGLDKDLSGKFAQMESLINQRNEVLEKKNERESERTGLRERTAYLEEKQKLLRGDVDEIGERLHSSELRLVEFNTECTSLKERTAADFGVDLEEFEPKEIPDPDEIEKLELSLGRIGTVNPLAPEEYEEEKKRLDFLKNQLNDLEMAREYLLETIRVIDETATTQFKKTFSEVRENFKAVFTKLFDGGVAEMRLEDAQDVFNSSIEIVANPRGKNLKSLDALSGGERALVAIAFLFSLYLHRPSPFCILDEIDAALDDANVARFLGFLKELVARTQFLIVTHNKRSMEAANSLYGITMEVPGISKVVSVRLRDQ